MIKLIPEINILKQRFLRDFNHLRAVFSLSPFSDQYSQHSDGNIIPGQSIAGRALIVVIAIMTFLACLTVGAGSIVTHAARDWQSDISREVTIQIKPSDKLEMDKAVREASRIALSYDGVIKVEEMSDKAISRLLEPWLGPDPELKELPVPRLLIVSLDENGAPDFLSMHQELKQSVPGVILDDHKAWVKRLNNMAWTMVIISLTIFFLVMSATVLIVIFTTRSAMAGNHDIIEVLHFVGADNSFIAKQFQHHFLTLGLIGATVGGAGAILLFIALGILTHETTATLQGDQINALFGTFSIGINGYLGMGVVILIVVALAMLTSRLTVKRYVWILEKGEA